ncbi:MAG: hypothetical protein AAF939_13615 [Planctomycetota bacterium]
MNKEQVQHIKELIEQLDRAMEQFLNQENEPNDEPPKNDEISSKMIQETNHFLTSNLPDTYQPPVNAR